jgi:hypothetical protein
MLSRTSGKRTLCFWFPNKAKNRCHVDDSVVHENGQEMFKSLGNAGSKFAIFESVWFAQPELLRRELFVLLEARMVVQSGFTKISQKKISKLSVRQASL